MGVDLGCCDWYCSISQPSYIYVSVSGLSYVHINFDPILFSIGLVRFLCHLNLTKIYVPKYISYIKGSGMVYFS